MVRGVKMNASLALLSTIVVTLLLMRKIGVGLSLIIGSALLSLLIFGSNGLVILVANFVSIETLRIVVIVILAFTLGYSMEYFGMLERLSKAVSNIFGGLSFLIIPLLVGLLPMPGGALISAVMLKSLVKKYALNAEKATFLNHWYRHIWVTVWPIYPSVIIGAAVLETNYLTFISATVPIAFLAFFSGLIWTRGMEKKFNFDLNDFAVILRTMYPIFLVATLTLLFRLDLLVTLLTSLIILFLQHRSKVEDLTNILRKTVDLKIILLVFAVMGYKAIITISGAAEALFEDLSELSIPYSVAAFLITFLVSFSTGIELSYTSVALPLFLKFTGVGSAIVPENLMFIISAGFLGVMLSPMHLCYILTAEYFKANFSRCYIFILPVSLMVLVGILTIFSLHTLPQV